MNKIVCFTGHREISDAEYPALWKALDAEIERLIANGAEIFRAGGALGFDTMAALCVLSHRLRHPQIRLELILPCPSQTQGWKKTDQSTYNQILSHANAHRYVSAVYYNGVMHARNRALVDGADLCLAYLRTSHGGTAYTVSYALRSGVELINLYDTL